MTQATIERQVTTMRAMLAVPEAGPVDPAEIPEAAPEPPVELPSLDYMRGYLQHYADSGPVLDETARGWLDALIDEVERHRAMLSTQAVAKAAMRAVLTDREMFIARLLAARMTYTDIARELYISLNTVKTHAKHIYAKLECDRDGLAVKLHQLHQVQV